MMERYLHSQQAKALETAAKRCGLDAHITYIENRTGLHTWADKIAGRFFRKRMPIKRSYLYCNTLDMDFFFLEDGTAVYTYAGYADARDATEEKIVNAFRMANQMRLEMENAMKELQEGRAMNGIVYVKAIVQGENASGQKLVKLVAQNTDGIRPFWTDGKDLICPNADWNISDET